ncbi:Structural maintenance of chromosomes protein 5 [Borealophlyctis nickersoniae]|nr:Structural maintenance of chromosomes protein 5 [Borealophlyctis nickersoniae]
MFDSVRPVQLKMSSRRRVIEEEEEDEPMENGEVIGSGSVEQEKRGDDDGEKEHSQDEEDGAEDKEGPSPKRQRLEGGAATSKSFVDEDGFREGAIIRIRCRNFVTYDYVELKPGPSLNMIIGPNGTGKSSIVCAMAIALGNNPKVVGRSPDISAYVKEGEEKAWVEIELKRRGKGRNLIIKRSFGRDGNSSTYKLNGEHATEKAVKDKVQALNIKVDNLCSFLPQDRVSDFAKMTKRELLRATEGSIGSAQLTEWHDRLVEMRREEKGILASVQAIKDDVEKLNERTAKMQRDVIRYEERQAFLAEVKEIELKISFQKYSDARAEYIEAKEKRDALKVQFAELKNRLQPLETELNELQAEIKSADAEVKQYNIEQQKQEKDINKAKENITKCESEGDDLCNRLKTIKRREREKQEKLAAMRADIEKLQNSLTALEEELSANGLLDVGHSSQPRGELASIQGEIEEKNRALREIAEKIIDIQQDQRSINEECQEIRRNKDNLAEQLRGLDDVKNQKLENLRRFHPNEYKATLWLRENRHTFKSTIYDPICLEIGPKDMRYASPLETNIPMNRMKTFVTTCKEDYYALQHQLFDVMKLRVNLSKPDNLNLETYVPKIPREEVPLIDGQWYLQNSPGNGALTDVLK